MVAIWAILSHLEVFFHAKRLELEGFTNSTGYAHFRQTRNPFIAWAFF